MISPVSVFTGGLGSALLTGLSAYRQYQAVPVLYLSSTINVRLENFRYKLSADAEVSTQVLIAVNADGTSNKQYITDNVAPGPRKWQIEGFVTTSDLSSAAFSAVNLTGFDTTITLQVEALWQTFYSRSTFLFQDAEGKKYPNVAIVSLDFEKDPLTQNKVPISISLQEVNILTLNTNGIATTAVPNDPTNPATNPLNLANTFNTIISNPSTILAQVFGS
jgi:hypothetical protein